MTTQAKDQAKLYALRERMREAYRHLILAHGITCAVTTALVELGIDDASIALFEAVRDFRCGLEETSEISSLSAIFEDETG